MYRKKVSLICPKPNVPIFYEQWNSPSARVKKATFGFTESFVKRSLHLVESPIPISSICSFSGTRKKAEDGANEILAQWVDPVIKALEKADSSYEESLDISEPSEIQTSVLQEEDEEEEPSVVSLVSEQRADRIELLRRKTQSPIMFSDDESGSDKAASDDENDMDLSFAL